MKLSWHPVLGGSKIQRISKTYWQDNRIHLLHLVIIAARNAVSHLQPFNYVLLLGYFEEVIVVFILHSWNLCKVIIKYRLLMAWYLVWIILCFAGRHLIIWLPWDSLGQTSNQCTSSYHTRCSKDILFAHISLFSCNVYLYHCI